MSDEESIRRDMETRETEELVSILRKHDENEWRPEAFDVVGEVLRSRGVSPEHVAALGPEPVTEVEYQEHETIRKFFNIADAQACRLALESAGIPAWIADEGLGSIYGVGVGIRVQVRLEDREKAESVLSE